MSDFILKGKALRHINQSVTIQNSSQHPVQYHSKKSNRNVACQVNSRKSSSDHMASKKATKMSLGRKQKSSVHTVITSSQHEA